MEDVVGLEAHHVFPQEFEKEFLDRRINIHDPRFGSWVEVSAHRKWSYEYNARWRKLLAENPTVEEILCFAQQLAEEYDFDVYFGNIPIQ